MANVARLHALPLGVMQRTVLRSTYEGRRGAPGTEAEFLQFWIRANVRLLCWQASFA